MKSERVSASLGRWSATSYGRPQVERHQAHQRAK